MSIEKIKEMEIPEMNISEEEAERTRLAAAARRGDARELGKKTAIIQMAMRKLLARVPDAKFAPRGSDARRLYDKYIAAINLIAEEIGDDEVFRGQVKLAELIHRAMNEENTADAVFSLMEEIARAGRGKMERTKRERGEEYPLETVFFRGQAMLPIYSEHKDNLRQSDGDRKLFYELCGLINRTRRAEREADKKKSAELLAREDVSDDLSGLFGEVVGDYRVSRSASCDVKTHNKREAGVAIFSLTYREGRDGKFAVIAVKASAGSFSGLEDGWIPATYLFRRETKTNGAAKRIHGILRAATRDLRRAHAKAKLEEGSSEAGEVTAGEVESSQES